MGLNKVTYTNHQTVISAENMNAIQDAIIALENAKVLSDTLASCSSAAGNTDKLVTLTGFTLYAGVAINIKFTYSNTAANPTLNVNGTGAKPIIKYGATAAGTTELASWMAGEVVAFVYDGESWVMVGKNREATPADVGVGILTNLSTEVKTDLVSAVNEVDAHADLLDADIAPVFSTASTYAVGTLVTRAGRLYVCVSPVTTAGNWNPSNWITVSIASMVGILTNLSTEVKIDLVSAVNEIVANILAGTEVKSNYHLGFYIGEDGGLCQSDS